MRSFRRLALCGFSLLAIVATASAETIVPVNDDPPMAGFPEGTVLDVLGIKLGMTPDEVRAAYDGELEEEMRRIRMVNPDTSASFEIEYLYRLHTRPPAINRITAEYIQNSVDVTFGSPFVANRAVRISNTYRPPTDTPMSTKAFMQAVENKYGSPSGTVFNWNYSVWVFGPNGKATIKRVPEAFDTQSNVAGYKTAQGNYEDGPMPMCWQSSDLGVFGNDSLPYKFQDDRYIPADGCVGGLLVEPSSGETYYGQPVVAYDQRRLDADNRALDSAIKEALSKPPSNLIEPKL